MPPPEILPMNTNRCSLLLLSICLAACTTTSSNMVTDGSERSDSPWVQPAPLLAQQIQDEAARMPFSHGFDRLEQIRWFAAIGEPAYDTLLELASDPRDDVAAAALAALGATLDSRLVPHIHALEWSPERLHGDLELERSRCLVRLGDWSAMPTLIEGLEDERLFTRSLCLDALREATRESHGFDPRAEKSQRDKAVATWRQWWLARSGEGLLPKR
jgi:HEAT repeat protein